ncbi:MAG TPA: translation elongation factor Ts [Saprospiraceae bacterium]|nr:translation elongation factor Ts [Saprospiraceae bacterium]HMQ84090.1 translation elongation factor Ts [Saprospiraceae bacterium]
MSAIVSATDVKKLRDMTGAGFSDCKKALDEAAGDFEKAIEILRKKGQKVSAKRADNEAKEGVVIALVSDDQTRGVVVKLSSETDFVAKNQEFIDGTQAIAAAALAHFPADLEALKALPLDGGTVTTRLEELLTKFSEKIELSYEKLEAAVVSPYIHMGFKAGVLVGLNENGDGVYDAGRDVAMQVAAMKPVAVDKDGVDQTIIAKEIEIGMEQARQDGKPEQMLEKIAQGKLQKFFKENTLLNQQFVKDNSLTIQDFLRGVSKGLTVTEFKHVTLG